MEKDNVCDSPGLIPYPHHRGSQIIKPDLIKNPIAKIELVANQKLELLREQAEQIMKQAKKVLDNVSFTKEMYDYGLRFEPVIDHIYHVYERENEERFVSLIAPSEWGARFKGKHVYSARFCPDDTWEKTDEEL
jgi:hypothetical protein|tara:strand:- start:1686 stop:2087 length:402 start_codon:yes stop_codon:yes gene_type:complete